MRQQGPGADPTAGIVLAGGRSARMGTAKADLPWQGSTLLGRTCEVVADAVTGPVVVVRSPGQALPPLPAGVLVVDDAREGLGPLQGLASGLAAAAPRARTGFVCATDLPFLHAAFVRRVLAAFTDDVDVVLPVVGGRPQPLAAGYRTALAAAADARVAQGRLRLLDFVADCTTLHVDEQALRSDPALAAADPRLQSVVNVNEPTDYRVARRRDR